ncbi:chemotaxis protein [Maridesulfovibrio hydrothermalis]|uniref:Response regulator receiver modulated CheW protein n=1 Tax=Maridesulfovibrio hydrothermalis AM13 = DSM 14728 TaxID=1121451 RepID=L0RI45_9BACT|nr:chemotaxis protein [Maridesulfovibrio hydrothermalis]CCO25286.1 Response regulator receiver modulated CheW protein [Maridesulfovibrio hydrothermalis AM13 = DSM 14728]
MAKTDILLETGTNELEILEFYIDLPESEAGPAERCHFGVNVAKVMQVIESPQLKHPESAEHPCFMGTIPLRNHILPVLDLAVWLGLERKENKYDIVIVTEFSQTISGFQVSGVTEIHRVGWQQVLSPDRFMSSLDDSCIVGIVEREDRFIQLLDLESILADLDPTLGGDLEAPSIVASEAYMALVCDDSPTIRAMLEKSLDGANFRHTIVRNGQEAQDTLKNIKQIAQQENRPVKDFVEIVISDIEMPLMDGFSLTKWIRQDDALKDLPVILYSSIITKELKHKGESVGADDQVSKPDLNLIPGKAIDLIENRKSQ